MKRNLSFIILILFGFAMLISCGRTPPTQVDGEAEVNLFVARDSVSADSTQVFTFPVSNADIILTSEYGTMNKKTDVVSALVSEEHPFHQALTQPGKAKKHRYERRKVRSILKVVDWEEGIESEEAS